MIEKVPLMGYRCQRCQHGWLPRTKEEPRVCPKCKSPYWDKPRTDRHEAAKKAWETRRKNQ